MVSSHVNDGPRSLVVHVQTVQACVCRGWNLHCFTLPIRFNYLSHSASVSDENVKTSGVTVFV